MTPDRAVVVGHVGPAEQSQRPFVSFRDFARQLNAHLVELGHAPTPFDSLQKPLESSARGQRMLDTSHEGTTE